MMRMPCGHNYHVECVRGLDMHGLSTPCPACCERFLSGTPDALFDEAIRRLVCLKVKVRARSLDWAFLPAYEQVELDELVRMLKGAASDDGRDASAVAQFNLGLIYRDGIGVDPGQWDKAQEWFQKAATKGLSSAQYALGQALEREDSAGQKEERRRRFSIAAYYYRLAADQGHLLSMVALADMLRAGRGVPPCHAEALRLLRRASEGKHFRADRPWGRAAQHAGFAEAQFGLATMYLEAQGVHYSSSKAMMWFRRAADQGHKPAKRELAKLQKDLASGSHRGTVSVSKHGVTFRRAYYHQIDLAGKAPDDRKFVERERRRDWKWLS